MWLNYNRKTQWQFYFSNIKWQKVQDTGGNKLFYPQMINTFFYNRNPTCVVFEQIFEVHIMVTIVASKYVYTVVMGNWKWKVLY